MAADYEDALQSLLADVAAAAEISNSKKKTKRLDTLLHKLLNMVQRLDRADDPFEGPLEDVTAQDLQGILNKWDEDRPGKGLGTDEQEISDVIKEAFGQALLAPARAIAERDVKMLEGSQPHQDWEAKRKAAAAAAAAAVSVGPDGRLTSDLWHQGSGAADSIDPTYKDLFSNHAGRFQAVLDSHAVGPRRREVARLLALLAYVWGYRPTVKGLEAVREALLGTKAYKALVHGAHSFALRNLRFSVIQGRGTLKTLLACDRFQTTLLSKIPIPKTVAGVDGQITRLSEYRILRDLVELGFLRRDTAYIDIGCSVASPLWTYMYLLGNHRVFGFDSDAAKVDQAVNWYRAMLTGEYKADRQQEVLDAQDWDHGFFGGAEHRPSVEAMATKHLTAGCVTAFADHGFTPKLDRALTAKGYGNVLGRAFVQGWKHGHLHELGNALQKTRGLDAVVYIYSGQVFSKTPLAGHPFNLGKGAEILRTIPVTMVGSGEGFTAYIVRLRK